MKKVVIGMILTMVALVFIAPRYIDLPDIYGQADDTVETVNV